MWSLDRLPCNHHRNARRAAARRPAGAWTDARSLDRLPCSHHRNACRPCCTTNKRAQRALTIAGVPSAACFHLCIHGTPPPPGPSVSLPRIPCHDWSCAVQVHLFDRVPPQRVRRLSPASAMEEGKPGRWDKDRPAPSPRKKPGRSPAAPECKREAQARHPPMHGRLCRPQKKRQRSRQTANGTDRQTDSDPDRQPMQR
jgi:hypothetical protein